MWGRGGIGIRSGLKIRRRKACGFESHRPYQVGKWNDRRIDLGPSGGARTDEVDFRRENCPVGSFQEIARGLQPEGVRAAAGGAGVPPPLPGRVAHIY